LICLLWIISILKVVNKNDRGGKSRYTLDSIRKKPTAALQAPDEFDYVDYIPPVESYVYHLSGLNSPPKPPGFGEVCTKSAPSKKNPPFSAPKG